MPTTRAPATQARFSREVPDAKIREVVKVIENTVIV